MTWRATFDRTQSQVIDAVIAETTVLPTGAGAGAAGAAAGGAAAAGSTAARAAGVVTVPAAARFAAFDASPTAARMAAKLLSSATSSSPSSSSSPSASSSTTRSAEEKEQVAVSSEEEEEVEVEAVSSSSDGDEEEVVAVSVVADIEVAVADAQSALPFADGAVGAALSVFAPRNPAELFRVIASGGVAIVVAPGADHLAQMRALRGEGVTVLEVAEGKRERTAGAMAAAGFELVSQTEVEGAMQLGSEDVADLVGMGPSAFHQTEASLAALADRFDREVGRGAADATAEAGAGGGGGTMAVTKSFVVQCFRRSPDAWVEPPPSRRQAAAERNAARAAQRGGGSGGGPLRPVGGASTACSQTGTPFGTTCSTSEFGALADTQL
jgi:SAM-dependent methyltransferase